MSDAPTLIDLMDARGPGVYFDGETYDPGEDKNRLSKLLGRVWVAMADGRWHTLAWIHAQAGGSEASVSARLRDLRKKRFGEYDVQRRRVTFGGGAWEYRMAFVRSPK